VNRKQTVALWAAIGVFVLLGLFPPWTRTYARPGMHQQSKPAGYHFIMLPPSPEVDVSYAPYWGVEVDVVRLLIGWSAVVAVATGVAVALRAKPRPRG
jgi:hypothetical protein